jgi:hypothetical protein
MLSGVSSLIFPSSPSFSKLSELAFAGVGAGF